MSFKTSISDEVTTFQQSSAFTPGDPFSFKIDISESVSLPGKFDSQEYVNGLSTPVNGRAAVVCPGNGGLCVELLRRGANEVVAIEPRNQFWRSLEAINGFNAAVNGKRFAIDHQFPKESRFDLIIWPEGLDELRDPMTPLTSALDRLAPGGTLFIELTHGNQGPSPEHANSWRPTQGSFEETIEKLSGYSLRGSWTGRNSTRGIYEIGRDPAPQVQEPKPVEEELVVVIDETPDPEPAPKKTTKKKVRKKRGRPRKSATSSNTPKSRRRTEKE